MKKKFLVIPFREKINGISSTRHGFKVGNLILVPAIGHDDDVWMVYSLINCRPFFDPLIYTQDFAFELAEWLDQVYKNFIEIQQVDEYSDVISLCRYTVKYGKKIAEIHDKYKDQILTKENFVKLFK